MFVPKPEWLDDVTDIKRAWRPIKSAPRDGTRILGYGLWAGEINGPDTEPYFCVIYWRGGRMDYPGFGWRVEGTDAYTAWMRPTHWMPLPRPPQW